MYFGTKLTANIGYVEIRFLSDNMTKHQWSDNVYVWNINYCPRCCRLYKITVVFFIYHSSPLSRFKVAGGHHAMMGLQKLANSSGFYFQRYWPCGRICLRYNIGTGSTLIYPSEEYGEVTAQSWLVSGYHMVMVYQSLCALSSPLWSERKITRMSQ